MHALFYISGHGFGHASRDIQVVNALARLAPAAAVTLRTSVPEWFLRASLAAEVDIIPGETDTGMVQPDSLSIDEDESARVAARFYEDFPARVARESDLIHRIGASLVIGDVPPLAFAAAASAGVPSVALSNFTWDWIYAAYPQFDRLAPGVRQLIAQANAQATMGLRLPFAGGFESMRNVVDVPLVARKASTPREETRRRLRLPGDRPVVLATFGGHGGSVPLDRAATNPTFLLVATDYEVGQNTPRHPNLRVVRADELRQAGLGYSDLLAASDVVATKLGYGIVSECLVNDVALLYTLRGRFVEQDVFMREMPGVMRCRHIDRDDLREGRWAESVEALLAQPKPGADQSATGAEVAAERILSVGQPTRGPVVPVSGMTTAGNPEPRVE
jgi:hypothetical protein